MKYSMNVKSKTKKSSVNPRKKDMNLRAMNPNRFSTKGSSNSRYGNKHKKYLGLTKKSKKTPFKKRLRKFLIIMSGVGFFLIVALLIGGGLYLKHIEKSLPEPDRLVKRSSDQSTLILDREGNELYKIYADQNRDFVELESLPDHFKWAILSAEDIEFYNHKGLDLVAVARTAYNNLVHRRVTGGASTITQQLVRNTILFDVLGDEAYEQTYTRKIKELLITMQVEQTLTKDEILQMYINEVPFGGVNYGIQAAALAYFDKDAKDLTVAESAMLAGVIASPNNFSPIYGTDPDLAVRRQHIVLDLMLRNKSVTGVTEEEIEEAKEEELVYSSRRIEIDAPHFVFFIKDQLEEMYGIERVERGGLRVTTTLDPSVQEIAEEEITRGIENFGHRWNVNNGSMVVIDPNTNQIIAMVGSVDYWKTDDPRIDGHVNIATSLRQMGSSVKPYTYLTAFQQGYGPWLQSPDIEGFNFGDYRLQNWDGRYYGHMTARKALVQSRNISAVYTGQLIGVDSFIETAERLGITSLTQRERYGLSINLGAAEMKLLEHTAAFSVFANEGIRKPVSGILKVVDSSNDVLYEFEQPRGERVFDEKDIYAINWALCDVGGFADQLVNNHYTINGRRVLCGKTGTTDGPRDLSVVMYHKNLVVGIWAGNNNNIETPGAWSTTVPLPIAHSFMQRVSTKYEPELFNRPAGIQTASVCVDTGWLAEEDNPCQKETTIYIAGKVPPKDRRQLVKVCKDSGLISTNVELAERFDLIEEKYLLSDYEIENSFQVNQYLSYLKDLDDSNLLLTDPGKGDCDLPAGANKSPTVRITSPSSNQQIKPGERINVKYNANAAVEIDEVKISFDGKGIEDSYRIPADLSPGVYRIRVRVFDINGKDAEDTIVVVYVKEEEEEEEEN